MRIATLAGLALVLTVSAGAVSFSAIRQAEPTTIEAAYREALALSPLAYEVENAHRYWTGAEPDMRSDEAYYLETLQRRIRQDRIARAAVATPDGLNACVEVVLKACGVDSAGFLSAGDQGRLWWQIQSGFTDEDGVGEGVMIFREAEGGRLEPILWTFEGGSYENPYLERHGDGQWLLIVPGLSRGTGSGDMTVMMLWRDGEWRAVDTDWQSRAGALLNGLEVRHQPRWAFPRLVAMSPLWRPSDANCCGEAGWANLEFDIVDDRLTLVDLELVAPPAGG